MKKRILIFSLAYEPLVGGAEMAVRNLTDRLGEYEFDLVTLRFSFSDKKFERIGKVNVYRVGFGSRLGRYLYTVLAFLKGSKLHKHNAYQLTWAIMAAYGGGAALFFKWRYPEIKFLLTLQEGDPVDHIHKKVRWFRQIWKKVFSKADYIQAISNFLAAWAKAEGVSCPVEVIPNGVDIAKFSPNLSRNEKKYGDKFRIITVSRLVPKNGVDILIKAISKLPPALYQLEILGSGPEEENLKKLTRELKLESSVEFLGNINQAQLPHHLARADIFVRPSRSEGLGISFLEAMGAGLPIIATPVGGIPDFLTDGETGLFTRPEDPQDLAEKIRKLSQDHELYRKLAQNCATVAKARYNWDRIAQSVGEVFSKLIFSQK